MKARILLLAFLLCHPALAGEWRELPLIMEPIREIKRPTTGHIGLQNHDPGDVVWFKEVSVRPLASSKP